MRCRTCGFVVLRPKNEVHHWQHQQCSQCHYFKIGRHRRKNQGIKQHEYHDGQKHRYGIGRRPIVIVNDKNIDLYCKLSEIILGKKCKMGMVIKMQKMNKALFQVVK